jgi:hypothetical protein
LGGVTPFTWLWSNGGSTDSVITGLCAGNYCVTVTDFSGCKDSVCVIISDINLVIDSIVGDNASCLGVSNGSATVYHSGGFNPVSFLWTGGQTTQTAINLSAGTYYVTVTEANGCTQILLPALVIVMAGVMLML